MAVSLAGILESATSKAWVPAASSWNQLTLCGLRIRDRGLLLQCQEVLWVLPCAPIYSFWL